MSTTTVDDGSAERFAGRTFGGRFRTDRVLRRAQGVLTLSGEDQLTGRPVVVHVADVGDVSPRVAQSLEHDVAALRATPGEAIATVLGGGRELDTLFVATSHVSGPTLADLLSAGPIGVRDAILVGASVAGALAESHGRGVLHLDLYPGNVVVPEPGRAVLVGFGLPRLGRLEGSIRDAPVEQVMYVSPEQAGLIDRNVDERSDLYSLGLVLHTCVAGSPPFSGSDAGAVLRQHVSALAPPLGTGAPRALQEVVHRLLRKDPSDRYRTAAAVREDLNAIAAALERGEADPDVATGTHDERATLAEPSFIARDADLALLEDHLDRTVRGDGGIVFVEAASGLGKTALLDALASRAEARGMRVFRGQAVDRAAQRPYQLLSGVAAQVAAAASQDSSLVGELLRSVGDDASDAAAALPELAPALGAPASPRGPEAHAAVRTMRALSTVLDATGRSRPAAVLLDDCQWSDESTVRLLQHWIASPGRRRTVLVVAAFRDDEVPDDHPLRGVPVRARLRPRALDDVDVQRLAESMAGPLPPRAREVIVRLADGNPFMASAVLRGLLESGALVNGPEGWTVAPDALADVRSSAGAASVLAHRLDLLPPGTRRLLSVGAVLGKTFDPAFAGALSGVLEDGALREAERRQIVWLGERSASFVHDRLREALIEALPPLERTRLHAAAAESIERDDPSLAFELAYHFDEAGLGGRALPYALEAGAQARGRHALEVAEHQYRIADRAARAEPPDVRMRISRALGEVLMLRGRYEEAQLALSAAAELAADDVARAELEALLAELAFKRNDLDASGDIAEAALRRLGYAVPRRTARYLLAAIREIVVQAFHSLLPRRLGRRALAGAARDLLACRLYSRLAHVSWFTRGAVPTLWAHLREMNIAELYPQTAELAQAYSEHAPAMVLVPWYRRGGDYVLRSLRIRTDLGDVWGQGQSHSFLAIVALHMGRHRDCIAHAGEAIRTLERTGDRWERNIARSQLAFAHLRLGNLEEAVAEADTLCRDGHEIGDPQAIGIGLEIRSKATGGDVDAAALARESGRPTRDVQLRGHRAQGEAVRLIGLGRPAEAAAVLDDARVQIRRAGLKQEYVVPVWPWLAQSLRLQAESEANPATARTLLRTAGRHALTARILARQYPSNLPHALRESGLVSARRGRLRRARRMLDRSIAEAERLGSRVERATTLEARARIGAQVGWPGSRAALAEVARAETTLSLADRFDQLLEAGRRIAGALTRPAIFAAVHAATLTLLRGQRCVLLSADGDGFVAVGPDTSGGWDADLAARAVSTGIVGVGEGRDGIRSEICAPVVARGRAVGCIWTGHRELAGLFGPDEERIAGFIATLAGAALENAEGFAEVQELSRTLETRVDERTAQLAEANRELDDSMTRLRVALDRERDVSNRLRELDELKSDFLSTVSHELRTPLTSIQGFADTLVRAWDRFDEDRRRDFVGRIAAQSRELGDLILTLLDYSLAEGGRLDLSIGPEPVEPLVRMSLERLQRPLAGHTVAVEVAPDLVVRADRNAFARVLENLLTNAAKFSDPGSTISVGARRAGPMVEIWITDAGRGIPADERDHIFERFYRVQRGDTATTRGTGIGLAIAKQFVEAQGGRIRVDSTPGDGSTFAFTLAAAPA